MSHRQPGSRAVHQPEQPGLSSASPRVSRFTQHGRAFDDLRVMALQESIRETFLLVTVSVALIAVLTLVTGGPWPALITIPVVAVVLFLVSKAANQVMWAALTLAGGVGIALGASWQWVATAIVIGVLLR